MRITVAPGINCLGQAAAPLLVIPELQGGVEEASQGSVFDDDSKAGMGDEGDLHRGLTPPAVGWTLRG
jgi:hypothetical protein